MQLTCVLCHPMQNILIVLANDKNNAFYVEKNNELDKIQFFTY